LEEVRAEIEPMVAAAKNQTIAGQLAHTVETQAASGGLDKAAAANGLQVQQSGYIGRSDSLPGIGTSPQFGDAVFGMKANAAPASVPLAQGFAVAQVTEVKPPSTPTFEQVKDGIVSELKHQKAQALLAQKLQELSDKARASHNLNEAAKAVGATVKTSELVAPDGQVPDIGALASATPQVFDMKPGEISAAINLGQKGVVIDLLEKAAPTDTEFELVKSQVKAALLDSKRGEVDESFVVSLRDHLQKQGKVIIDQKKVEAMAGSKD
jgi:peptidyl-prolyl cis-trans isomerase D